MMIADSRQTSGFPRADSEPVSRPIMDELRTEDGFLSRSNTEYSLPPAGNRDVLVVACLLQ